jgi:hypothetical protein
MKQTAVEWLAEQLEQHHIKIDIKNTVVFQQAKAMEKEQIVDAVSGSLPTLDDATKVAVRISEEAITPPLDAKEQALFIAGFQECIKWLNVFFGNDR